MQGERPLNPLHSLSQWNWWKLEIRFSLTESHDPILVSAYSGMSRAHSTRANGIVSCWQEFSRRASNEGIELIILISHISEEALFALLLKDFIESTFLKQCEVSLISCSDDSAVGDKWLVELDGAFTAAGLLLVLCSPQSIRKPSVHFQFGCAWTRSVPTTCLCHSGLNKVSLPAHLRAFEGLDVDNDGFMEQLFRDLAKSLRIKRLPRLSYETMKTELRATLISIAPTDTHGDAEISTGDVKMEKTEIHPTAEPELPPEYACPEPSSSTEQASEKEEVEASEVKPLLQRELADGIEDGIGDTKEFSKAKPPSRRVSALTIDKEMRKNPKKQETPTEPESVPKRILTILVGAGERGYTLDDLSDVLGIVGPRLEPYLDVLKDQAYIDISVGVGRPPEYTIAAKGEQYLAESKPA